jgi:Tfp pilus assembly protein PilV
MRNKRRPILFSLTGFTPLEIWATNRLKTKRKHHLSLTGFTPLEITESSYSKNKRSYPLSLTGFTLVEIVVASLIIAITVIGTFNAYVYARQFSNQFRYRAQATAGAQEIAEYIRYRLAHGYRNETDLAVGTYADHSAVTDLYLQNILNPANWQINNLVDNLNISYTVSDVNFRRSGSWAREQSGLGADPPSRAFKKIIVRITYDNRTAT